MWPIYGVGHLGRALGRAGWATGQPIPDMRRCSSGGSHLALDVGRVHLKSTKHHVTDERLHLLSVDLL